MQEEELFFRDIDIADRYKVSRPTIWRWIKQKKFPRPKKLAGGSSRWRLSDIKAWEITQTSDEILE